MNWLITASLLLLLGGWSVADGRSPSRLLEDVRVHESPDRTRVVFDTTAAVDYELFTLNNPDRVVVDLVDTSLRPGFDLSTLPPGRLRVKGLRASARPSGYRVVLDVATPVRLKGFALKPQPPHGHRLVVDLFSAAPAADGSSGGSPAAVPRDEKRTIVIAIDAGHGGKDPGAVGPNGVREKNVVLSIARKLAAKLNRVRGYRTVLIRDGDYYVPLRDRNVKARNLGADLFVSIHADAFKSQEVAGASVFTLSDRGASSETARWLAQRENSYESIGGISLTEHDELVAKVLWDISMDASRSASIAAGERVLGALGSVAKLHKNRVEQAGFLVLKSPDVPSILVETGFISNPRDARRLNTSDYQDRIASAVAEGVRSYMEVYAPPGTLLAWERERGGVRYTIERGDTLSEIAARYRTSTRRIREANDLRGDSIRIGQTITIPAG